MSKKQQGEKPVDKVLYIVNLWCTSGIKQVQLAFWHLPLLFCPAYENTDLWTEHKRQLLEDPEK